VIRTATNELPGQLIELASEAAAAGINNFTTLIERWVDGTQRYDGPGESMLVAWPPGQ
jgi:hypothetical protein